MPCEKSRIIKARSPSARILEILSFSKFNREDYYFADNQIHIFGRYDKRNRGNGRILHAIRRTGTTGKAQPLERNAAAYLIGKLKRKRDRLCKPCRRSSFRSHTTRGRKANTYGNDELRVRLDRRLQRRKDIVSRRVPQFVQNLGNTGLSGRTADTHTRAAL